MNDGCGGHRPKNRSHDEVEGTVPRTGNKTLCAVEISLVGTTFVRLMFECLRLKLRYMFLYRGRPTQEHGKSLSDCSRVKMKSRGIGTTIVETDFFCYEFILI